MNKIVYRTLELTDKDIISGNCMAYHAMAGETLASDTLDFKIWADNGTADFYGGFITADDEIFTTSDDLIFNVITSEELTDFTPGDTVFYYNDNVLVNKFYLRDVKRVGKSLYDFSCVSAIGILDNTMHYGGIYTGEKLSTILPGILDPIDYDVDEMVGDIKVYGWLPYASKRENLQQITIATALSIKTKTDGTLHITALNSENKGTYGSNRTVVGGSVEVGTPCTAVEVMEHYFQEIEEEIILYNDTFLSTETILFPEPVHSLTITGGTIIFS